MNHPTISLALAAERTHELLAHADHHRLTTQATRSADGPGLVMRLATPRDDAALARLAVLDDASVPSGAVHVAVAGNVIVAAVGTDGTAIADPFVATAAAVKALRARLRDHEGAHQTAGRRLRRVARRQLNKVDRPSACTS